MTPLPPNAALEAAAVILLRSRLGYTPAECDRSLDGRPHPRASRLFVAVWSDGRRDSRSRVALDERFGINVTVTVWLVEPFDHAYNERDRLEVEVNRVRALLHGDTWGHELIRSANSLAGKTGPGPGSSDARPVGFCEALWLTGIDAWEAKSGNWFVSKQGRTAAGVAQTCRFGGARLIQAVPTAV